MDLKEYLPSSDSYGNVVSELFGLAKTAIQADAAKKLAATAPSLGVDEQGKVFERGAPAVSFLGGVPPLVLVGVGVMAVALVVYLAKN